MNFDRWLDDRQPVFSEGRFVDQLVHIKELVDSLTVEASEPMQCQPE